MAETRQTVDVLNYLLLQMCFLTFIGDSKLIHAFDVAINLFLTFC